MWHEKDIARVPHVPWQAMLRSKLFPYQTLNLEKLPTSLRSRVKDMKQELPKYEELERHAMLELAAWKIVTFTTFCNTQTGLAELLGFFRAGWKKY